MTDLTLLYHEKLRLQKDIISKSTDGYLVFAVYDIKVNDQASVVDVYKHDEFVGKFASLKNALAWCTADKFNQIALCNMLVNLDHSLSRLQNEIHVTKQSLKTSTKNKQILTSKIYTKISVLENVKIQLKKSIEQAKYLQIRGFYHETR